MSLMFDEFDPSSSIEEKKEEEKKEWQRLLIFIAKKETYKPEFNKLFEEILSNKEHHYHGDAYTLEVLYDFTPLRKSEEEIEV